MHMTIMSTLRSVSKRAWAVVALATAVVAVPAGLLAWGPDRPTFTMANPADHVTFNSITDATNYGDERNFVTISKDGKTYGDDITVENNNEYIVRVYVHNNAAANLNLVAKDVITKLNVPTQRADRIQIDGYLNSSNASPKSIWDQAVFHGANGTPFTLSYVAGSAYYKNAKGNHTLGDSIVSSGAKLGYDKMDGNIPGCFQYSGAVYLKVKAKTADFSINKTVRKAGSGSFTKSISANAGDKVDYQLYFKNTGGLNQTTVSIKDMLPSNMTYVTDSTYVHDDKGTRKVADGVAAGGMTMGSYLPQGDVYIKFTVQVASKDKLVCGTNKLVNKMSATTAESGTKTDTATVEVNKECVPPKKVTACNLKTKAIEQVEESKIDDVNYSLDLNKCKEVPPVKVKACNLDTMKLETVEKSKIDDVHYTLDLSKCDTPTPEKVKACNLDTFKIETVEQTKVDNVHYTTDLSKCQQKVCRVSDKQIVTIYKADFDKSKYTTDLNACAKTPETPETPETPKELPHTGVTENFLSVLGLGSLVGVAGAYIASRRGISQ